MKTKISLILISFIVCISCNNNKFENFPNTYEIKPKIIENKDVKTIREILGITDSLIITNTYNKNGLIRVFNKSNYSLSKSFINIGKGPDEINGPGEMAYNPKTKKIYIVDNGRRKIFVFSLTNLYQDDNPINIIPQASEIDFISDMEIINDTLFALTGVGKSKSLIYLINKNGKVINKIGKLPESSEDINDFYLFQKYNSNIHYSNSQKQLVFGYKYYPKLYGYSLDGDELFKIFGPDEFEPFFPGKVVRQKSKVAYGRINSTENFIYALYSGKFETIVHNEGLEILEWDYFYPMLLHIFTKDGDPYLKLKLKDEMSDFFIDPKTGNIISICAKTGNFYIYNINSKLYKNQ